MSARTSDMHAYVSVFSFQFLSHVQETADERWRPILGVESILVSVLSMLSDPNDESPANIDAGVMWREDRDEYKRVVRRVVRRSQEEL
jgi:ubiquitin-conjugating enzyme E2 G1